MMAKMVCAVVTGLVAAALAAGGADAQSRGKAQASGHVKVCSTYSNGCTSAPVRRGSSGYEVRLPSGTWIECRGNCRDTLREETLDFWETQRENQPF